VLASAFARPARFVLWASVLTPLSKGWYKILTIGIPIIDNTHICPRTRRKGNGVIPLSQSVILF
jgi:hypothetical protein